MATATRTKGGKKAMKKEASHLCNHFCRGVVERATGTQSSHEGVFPRNVRSYTIKSHQHNYVNMSSTRMTLWTWTEWLAVGGGGLRLTRLGP